MSYLLKYLSIAETCRIKEKWKRNVVGSKGEMNGLPKPNASSSVCKAPATLTYLDISPYSVWPGIMCFWNMASSSVIGTLSMMAHTQQTHVHMDMKIELNSLILMHLSLNKFETCVANSGNQLSSHILTVSFHLWLCQDCVASLHPSWSSTILS